MNRSVAYMEKHRDRPFFLFFSSHDLHVPRMPHERFHGASDMGWRGDAIVQLDWCVGALTEALDRLQLRDDTLIVFCSDNGPVLDDGYVDQAVERLGDHRPAGPFKGGKYTVYEGGTRTPFIASWPGTIAPGVTDGVISTIDLATTLSRVAGAPEPEGDLFPDSFDLSGLLLGRPDALGRDHLIQQDNGRNGRFGYLRGRYKLVRHDKGRAYNADLGMKTTRVPRFTLHDLIEDPGETVDLAASRPELLATLQEELQRAIEAAGTRPAMTPRTP